MVKIGINGFGRLGRQLLKVVLNKSKDKSISELSRVVMINDSKFSPECMVYLFKNDTFYGKSNYEIVEMDKSIVVDGQTVEISRERNVESIPWQKAKVDYVVDTTGENITCETASKHLQKGVKRVIVTGCANLPMFVYGVNHGCFKPEMTAVSATSPSMNCLLAMLKVLHENFEIQGAMSTALKPLGTSDKILDDALGKSMCRNSRSATVNFAPTESSTTKRLVGSMMPELEGRTESSAVRIPVTCVGAIDLTLKFAKKAPYELMKCRVREASETYMKGVLRYTDDDIVSSDVIGDGHSCVFDGKAGIGLSTCFAKVFAWYDSEYGFANRIFDLVSYIASRDSCQK